MPMSGVAFLLFTFYMVTDPPTTPSSTRGQILFGSSVAAVYGMLMLAQVVFGLFFSLSIVATVRGIYLYAKAFSQRSTQDVGAVQSSHDLAQRHVPTPRGISVPATSSSAAAPAATEPSAYAERAAAGHEQ